MFRIMLGGWLDLLCTYRGVVAGFENGLNLPVVRSRVTSRKLTIFLFASMVGYFGVPGQKNVYTKDHPCFYPQKKALNAL